MTAKTEPASPHSGAAELVRTLREAGVEELFGLPGVHNLAIWSAALEQALRVVGVRHEQTAVYAADGGARTTGRLGVAVTTTGPGAANALGATGEAWASKSPVLVIATDIPSTLRRPGVYRGVLHETTDQAGMFRAVTKSVFVARTAAEIARLTREAIATAMAAPQGPTYLEIPTDLLAVAVEPDDPSPLPPSPPASPEPTLIAVAAEKLQAAHRPLIWAGGGATSAGAGEAIADLARRVGAPVLETYQGRGALPLEHPFKVTASVHDPEIGPLWDEADVVLAIGSDLDGMTTQNWLMPQPPMMIAINVDDADATKNYAADILLEADAALATAALLAELEKLPRRTADAGDYAVGVAERQCRAYESLRQDEPAAGVLLDTLSALPPEVPIFADMCIAGYWTASYHAIGRPRKLAYPVGWGTLGFSLPSSIGAAVTTGEPVLCICGDGGFLFAAGELAAIAQEQPPLTILVVDDGGYGMLRYDQVAAGDEPSGTDLTTPDFVALAESFGIPGQRVEGLGEELASALLGGLAADGPRLIVVGASLKPPVSTSPRWYRRKL